MILTRRKSVWTRQPQGPVSLNPAYGDAPTTWLPANQRALSYNGAFLVTKTDGVSNPGRYVGCDAVAYSTAMANAAASSVNTRSFSLLAVLRLNGSTGAGVGIRDKGSNILLRRNSGNWSVRIAGGDYSGSAVPLGVWLTYILNSSPAGVSLTVNGATVLSGAAASSGSMGSVLDLWSDSQGGGSVNMDLALLHVQRRPLTPTEIRALSANPWAIHRPRTRRTIITLGAPSVPAGAELDGNAQAHASATGTLTLAASLDGLALGVASANGTLSTQIPLAGAAVSVVSATGQLLTGIKLTAAAVAQTIAAGALTAQIRLDGAALAQTAAAAGLTSAILLAGSAQGQAGASGALTAGADGLEGEARAQAGAVATLTASIRLEGTAAAQAGVAGILTTAIPLSATALAAAIATGTLAVPILLAGHAQGVVSASGVLTDASSPAPAVYYRLAASVAPVARLACQAAPLAQLTAADRPLTTLTHRVSHA